MAHFNNGVKNFDLYRTIKDNSIFSATNYLIIKSHQCNVKHHIKSMPALVFSAQRSLIRASVFSPSVAHATQPFAFCKAVMSRQ